MCEYATIQVRRLLQLAAVMSPSVNILSYLTILVLLIRIILIIPRSGGQANPRIKVQQFEILGGA